MVAFVFFSISLDPNHIGIKYEVLVVVHMVLDSASFRLSVSAWNINGLKSTLLDQKLEHKDFLTTMKRMDFFAVCETWTREREFNVPNFRCFVEPATKLLGIKCGRNSGGFRFFIKNATQTQ